jgi:hypothetical protein
MAKLKVLNNEISGTAEDIMDVLDKATNRMARQNEGEKLYIISAASLSADFCHYSYSLASGITRGDEVNRKGSLIVHDDLKNAFEKLYVHLAAICEEIDYSKIKNIETIEAYDEDNHKTNSIEYKVSRFYVSGFSIKGTGENEGVVINGSKLLSTDDSVKLTSPNTSWGGDYPYINELKVAIDNIIFEVEEYMNGKSKPRMIQPELPGLDNENQNEGE